MSWNGQVPTDANWQGAPQLPGGEELYTTPSPATTTTNPSIGIVDGNLIPLPTSYNTLNVSGLTATTISGTTANLTTINSTNINNTENINTATINGNPVPTSAELWSLYPAVHNVTGLDTQQPLYVARQLYALNDLVSIAPNAPIYSNWKKNIASYTTINPANTLDPWSASAYVRPYDVGCSYNGVQYTTVANSTNQPPPNASYWRLATWDSATSYATFDFASFGGNWYQAGAPPPVAGVSPPGVGWILHTDWIPYVPVAPDPAFDITNFKTISSTTSDSSTMNTGAANALSVVNIGGNNSNPFLSTIGGALYVGKDTTNTSQTKPVVQIGNATVGGSTVTIFGDLTVSNDATVTGDTELKKTTIEGDTTITSEGGALVVNGGTTLDGGAATHGTTITALGGTIRLDVLPVGIDITSATGIVINAGVLTEISGLAGAVLTSAAATSVSAGGALSLAGGSYIEYNTDQNYFRNTSAGNDFTDIYVGNIHPADGGSAPLRINDGTGRGVQIDNGTTWNTDTLNATTVNATDVNASGSVTATANVYAVDVIASGSVSAANVTATGNVSAGVDVIATGNVSAVDVIASGQLNTPLILSPGTLGMYSDEATAGAFNMIGWGGIQAFTNNTQNAGTIDGNITFTAGGQVSFVAGNGGDITFDTTPGGNGVNFPPTRDQKFLSGRDIYLTAGNDIIATSVGTTTIDSQGNLDLKSATGSAFLDASTEVAIGSATSYISLTAAVGQVVKIQSPLDMSVNDITNVNTIAGTVGLSLVTQTNGNLNLFPNGTGTIVASKNLNMTNNNIINANTITGQTALTLASTGNSNINISPAGTGQVSINKQVNFNSQTLFNMTLTNCDGIYSRPTGPLVLVSQQAVSPAVQIRGALTMWATGSVQAPGNSIAGLTTLTGQTDLTLATQTNGNLNLSPNGTGIIEANKNLDMNNNNIVGGNTIVGTSILTLTTLSNGNLNLTPDGTGVIVANKTLNMNNNNITGGNTITGTTALTLATTGNNNINISPAGTGQVIINKQVDFSSQTLFNMTLTNVDFIYSRTTGPLRLISQQAVPSVEIRGALTMWLNSTTQAPGNSINGLTTLTGQTTLGLATLSNGDLSLSPNGTGTIIANKTLNMNTNAITNLTTLNGRNLFAYGNFYNTATQTLGAINTATRIEMNTSLNNNLITLDTTTNIGRITFTNAGVYHVVWNAYLLHGSGGTTKTRIWIRLNGTDVGGSGKTEDNDSQQNETNMTSSSMVSVTASQYIEFYWAADGTNVPLTAVAASAPYPATPSFSCTVSIVG